MKITEEEKNKIFEFRKYWNTSALAVPLLYGEYSGWFYTVIPESGNRRSDIKETEILF